MPISQTTLNFPKRKARSCQLTSKSKVSPSKSKVLLEENETRTCLSGRRSTKQAKDIVATAFFNSESFASDDAPDKASKPKAQSSKRKQNGTTGAAADLCSPRKSPCKSYPVVSPIRLKAFRGTYKTVPKTRNAALAYTQKQEENVTSDSSDDEITISCHATPVKKQSVCDIVQRIPALQNLDDKDEILPLAPVTSPESQVSISQVVKLGPVSPTELCSKLSNLASPKKQSSFSDGKENTPTKSCYRRKQTSKRDHTPKKCDVNLIDKFSPLKDSCNILRSPLRVIKVVNSGNGFKIQDQIELKPVKVNLSDILKTSSNLGNSNLKIIKEVGSSSNKSCNDNVAVINGLLSPVKSPEKCLTTRTLVNDENKKALRSPLKRLNSANACHLRSPLKQLQASGSIAPDSPLRRSPRKHDANCSPGRALLSPVKKLSLGSVGPIQVHKPDVSCYQAVRKALSHTMPVLVGRATEVNCMSDFLKTCLQDNKAGAMYISGAPGTGKTAALTHILDTLPEAKDLAPVWVNCMGLQGSSAVFSRISEELSLPQQPTELKTLRALERHFSKKGKSIVLMLDEADQLETRHQELLYTIFEWPALQGSRLLLLAIANRLDLTERVLPRLSVAGNCAPHRLHFPPYTKAQIVEILTDRLNKSGVEWRSVIRPPALQLLAGKVASVAGDARRALDVCRRAVETCQTRAQQSTLVPLDGVNKSVVDMGCIVKIFNDVYGSRVVTTLAAAPAAFPLQQKILLCCLLLVHKHAKQKHTTMGKLQEIYSLVCSHRQMPAVDASEFMSLCCNLETRAMIAIGKSKDIRMAKVSLPLNPDEAERALADRELMLQILEDTEALGRLAKKK